MYGPGGLPVTPEMQSFLDFIRDASETMSDEDRAAAQRLQQGLRTLPPEQLIVVFLKLSLALKFQTPRQAFVTASRILEEVMGPAYTADVHKLEQGMQVPPNPDVLVLHGRLSPVELSARISRNMRQAHLISTLALAGKTAVTRDLRASVEDKAEHSVSANKSVAAAQQEPSASGTSAPAPAPTFSLEALADYLPADAMAPLATLRKAMANLTPEQLDTLQKRVLQATPSGGQADKGSAILDASKGLLPQEAMDALAQLRQSLESAGLV